MKKKSAVITNKINDIVNSDVQLNDYLLGDTLGIGGFDNVVEDTPNEVVVVVEKVTKGLNVDSIKLK